MIHRFADFEIDEARREIRLRGREIPVQPRVLDLLAYLVRHRERVVNKDELLGALWPGTVVVDGALQRIVSLARSALQQGGQRDAIRTYARHGYRFCGAVDSDATPVDAEPMHALPSEARQAYRDKDWPRAMVCFREADRQQALTGLDLERWALANQWAGNPAGAFEPLERAVAAHLSQSDRRGAARASVQLAQIAFERLDLSVAKGWHHRASSLLNAEAPCRELGLLHVLSARLALFAGELESALEHAQRTLRLGIDLEDADLEALGLLYSGHALLSLGEIEKGVDCQDEAAAAVLSGQITPWVGSLVYCGVVWACRNRVDLSRAAQWTQQFKRWCDRHGLAAFPGTCRLHHAEVLSVRGDFAEAEKELDACLALLAEWAPWAEGDAYRVLGDMRLAQGKLDLAGEAYSRARALGWDPQPGHAMLQLARGDAAAAVAGLATSLADRNWANRERRGLLLTHMVIAAAAARQLERARAAIEELTAQPGLSSTPALRALVHSARAQLAESDHGTHEAIAELREAQRIWRQIGAPLNVAHLQRRIGELLLEAGRPGDAEIELTAAAAAFRAADAELLADACRRRLTERTPPKPTDVEDEGRLCRPSEMPQS